MLEVLIVDDSPTACRALRLALEKEIDIYVVAEASNQEEALRLIRKHQPDIVTMDVHLKREDGIQIAARIMVEAPVPILIVTGVYPSDPRLAYRAMEAGALEVAPKLPMIGSSDYERQRLELVRLVRTLAEVPVVHRIKLPRKKNRCVKGVIPAVPPSPTSTERPVEIVLVGASTGGPPVIASLLEALPTPFELPVAIVQHIAPGFASGLAEWLQQTSGHKVVLVDRPRAAQSGEVYLAPEDRHLVVGPGSHVSSSDEDRDGCHRPAVNVLFESAARRRLGPAVVAVLLTGMGSDGARGLSVLRDAGALTIAQDPTTCAVGSMPQAAIAAGVVDRVMTPDEIGALLANLPK